MCVCIVIGLFRLELINFGTLAGERTSKRERERASETNRQKKRFSINDDGKIERTKKKRNLYNNIIDFIKINISIFSIYFVCVCVCCVFLLL